MIKIDIKHNFNVTLAKKTGKNHPIYGIVANDEELTPDVPPEHVIIPEPVIYGSESITRRLPGSVQLGAEVEVSLEVNAKSSTYYIIDEIIPDGWNVISASDGGSFINDGHIKWAIISGVRTGKVYTYTLRADSINGVFSGTCMFEKGPEGVEQPIQGDFRVIVSKGGI